ncbi:hypothetical protein [Emticicia fontis]
MKKYAALLLLLISFGNIYAQKAATSPTPPVPCQDQAEADRLPGKYTDHTQPKYPFNLKGTATEKAAMTKNLIVLEKLEEASRKDFTLTGCVARVSFANWGKTTYRNETYTRYGYQLGVYMNVCHVTEHVVKTVDEYRTVLRVDINPTFADGQVVPGGTGSFYLSDRNTAHYEIPIDAKMGPTYDKDRITNPSRISRYISEAVVLTSRSNNYKDFHTDFLKLINGEGAVENWMSGSRYDKPNPKAYHWIDKHWLITKPGVPLLIPITRKQYLEDLLEYYEIEKANFFYSHAEQIKSLAGNTSDFAKKRLAVLEADKGLYLSLYEAQRAKVQQILATEKADFLQKPAVVASYGRNITDGNQRVADLGKFFEQEGEKTIALYQYNPQYFKQAAGDPTKPLLFEVQFRYEISPERGFSERLFNNFMAHYDFEALRKMLE